MSNSVTASEQYYVIKLDGKNSGSSPRGQKDAYPIKYVEFPDIGTKVNLSDDSTYVNPRYPLFVVFDPRADGDQASASLIDALNSTLEEVRNKQSPLKVTLIRLVNQTKEGSLDIKKYELDRTVELDKASIQMVAGSRDTFQVQAETATLGTGDKATNKIEINYKDKI